MWAITTRRPNDQFVGLNRFFDEAFNVTRAWPGPSSNGASHNSVDITEDEQGIRVTAEVPGYKPESLKVTLENQVLTLSGEKANGSFRRSFTVPNTIDAEKIEATVEHGILTVVMPRAEAAKPREILVKAG